jgi:hypothetical protein
VKLGEFVGIADDEIHRAAYRIGRALLKEHLHVPQVHARERRRVAPGERQMEAELFRVEFDGGKDVVDR